MVGKRSGDSSRSRSLSSRAARPEKGRSPAGRRSSCRRSPFWSPPYAASTAPAGWFGTHPGSPARRRHQQVVDRHCLTAHVDVALQARNHLRGPTVPVMHLGTTPSRIAAGGAWRSRVPAGPLGNDDSARSAVRFSIHRRLERREEMGIFARRAHGRSEAGVNGLVN